MAETMCGICRHPTPGHQPGCPVATGEPQLGTMNMLQQMAGIPSEKLEPQNQQFAKVIDFDLLISAYQEVIESKDAVIEAQRDLIETMRAMIVDLRTQVRSPDYGSKA